MKLMSPKGNLAHDGKKVSRKLGGGVPPHNPLTKMTKPRLMCSDVGVYGKLPPGEDTVGGVVGGKAEKASHQGMKAGGKGR